MNDTSLSNAGEVATLIIDSISHARLTKQPKDTREEISPKEKRYEYFFGKRKLHFGPAQIIFEELPDPKKIFTPEESASLYQILIEAFSHDDLDSTIFLQALNYSDCLYDTFSSSLALTELDNVGKLERQKRKRWLQGDCFSIIRQDNRNSKESLQKLYRAYLQRCVDGFIMVRDYGAAINYLLEELNTNFPRKIADFLNTDGEQLYLLGYYNNLLGVLPPEELATKFQSRIDSLPPSFQQQVNTLFGRTISGLEMQDFTTRQANTNFPSDLSERQHLTTVIETVTPNELPVGQFNFGSYRVSINEISDPFADPIFRLFHDQMMLIAEFPLALLSPLVHRRKKSTQIVIEFDNVLNLDFTIGEDGEIEVHDLAESRAIQGSDFDPYIARVAKTLLKLCENKTWSNKGNVLKALTDIQSYTVRYSKPSGENVYFLSRALKSVDFFRKIRDKFVQNYRGATTGIISTSEAHAALLNHPVNTSNEIRKFSKYVITKLIAKQMAKSDLWKDVWVTGTKYRELKSEPDVQRIFRHILKPWFEIRGLSIHSGAQAAGGETDFIIEGREGLNILQCPIELKFAHHQHLDDGLAIQLPAYMNDLETTDGILLVIWCKGATFDKPTKFDAVVDLKDDLQKAMPNDVVIEILTVDAAYRESPSKRH